MTIDELLEAWARWRALREDNGLGYSSSRINMLMGGGRMMPRSYGSLPYGIDVNSSGAVMDRAICRLSNQRKIVVALEYCRLGSQSAKAAGMNPPIKVQTYRNTLCEARNQLSLQPDVKKLLTA